MNPNSNLDKKQKQANSIFAHKRIANMLTDSMK